MPNKTYQYKNQPYIQFPVSMLAECYDKKSYALIDMIFMGCHIFSKRLEENYSTTQIAGQLMYHYLTDRNTLTNELAKFIHDSHGKKVEGMGTFFCSQEYRDIFFEHGILSYGGTDRILEVMMKHDPTVLHAAKIWFLFFKSMEYFQLKKLFEWYLKKGNKIETLLGLIDKFPIENQPLCMVKLSTIKKLALEQRPDYIYVQFACFASIKSIIGNRDYCLTNKKHIVARMFGAKSVKNLPEINHPLFDRLSKRYHIDKLLRNLVNDWGLIMICPPGTHGIYLSFKYDLQNLAAIAIKNTEKYKNEKTKSDRKKAIEMAKQRLFE